MSETPLHEASENNDAEKIRLLINQGTDVNSRGGGDTPLCIAAWYNALDAATVLLEQGAKVDARAGNGWTPLHYAAVQQNKKMHGTLSAMPSKSSPQTAFTILRTAGS